MGKSERRGKTRRSCPDDGNVALSRFCQDLPVIRESMLISAQKGPLAGIHALWFSYIHGRTVGPPSTFLPQPARKSRSRPF
jgi:hypothetical protein